MNADTERNEHQNTEFVDINAPEEKHSDSAAEVVHVPVPVNLEGQRCTALVNTE